MQDPIEEIQALRLFFCTYWFAIREWDEGSLGAQRGVFR